MKKSTLFIALAITSTTLLNSCGVIFGGSKYEGTITAKDHPNAEIYVDGQKIGQGTTTKLFPREKALTVELKQEGCEPTTQTFDKQLRTGNFILSALSWGIPGIIVDLATGAAYKPAHEDNPAIQQVDTKKFNFNVDYSKCKKS